MDVTSSFYMIDDLVWFCLISSTRYISVTPLFFRAFTTSGWTEIPKIRASLEGTLTFRMNGNTFTNRFIFIRRYYKKLMLNEQCCCIIMFSIFIQADNQFKGGGEWIIYFNNTIIYYYIITAKDTNNMKKYKNYSRYLSHVEFLEFLNLL